MTIYYTIENIIEKIYENEIIDTCTAKEQFHLLQLT